MVVLEIISRELIPFRYADLFPPWVFFVAVFPLEQKQQQLAKIGEPVALKKSINLGMLVGGRRKLSMLAFYANRARQDGKFAFVTVSVIAAGEEVTRLEKRLACMRNGKLLAKSTHR